MSLPIIVQKYGGSSVATVEAIKQVAQLIASKKNNGFRLCVVVSAMGKTTDQLLSQAYQISSNPSRRELDMLLSCGERASMALLAMALENLGVPSVSLTGSQSGIITNDVHSGAKIVEIRPHRVIDALDANKVVIVAGFQGVSINREITTLGRGGSDTTAVALAAALNADACEIYSDVDGVLTADPRTVPSALRIEHLNIEEMEQLALCGAKVLNAEAVAFAKRQGIVIHAKKTGAESLGTLVSNSATGSKSVTAISHRLSIEVIPTSSIERSHEVLTVLDRLGIAPIFVSAEQIWAPIDDAHEVLGDRSHGTVSLIGVGCGNNAETIKTALNILAAEGIISTSFFAGPLSLTILLPTNKVSAAANLLHRHFLEKDLTQLRNILRSEFELMIPKAAPNGGLALS